LICYKDLSGAPNYCLADAPTNDPVRRCYWYRWGLHACLCPVYLVVFSIFKWKSLNFLHCSKEGLVFNV